MRNLTKPTHWIFISCILILSSCGSSRQASDAPDPFAQELIRQSTGATLWMQYSAEAQLIYEQTYHYARMQLDRKMRLRNYNRPAVILDLDETVLDNSPYQGRLIREGRLYNEETWNQWVREEKAAALPGALDFVNYARSRGLEIFYISNRSDQVKQATINNLVKLGFPMADDRHVLLKSGPSDKTERRNTVTDAYQVLLYLGDNLRDFSEIFNERDEDQGSALVNENLQDLLNNFVLFPNPVYGEWEEALIGNQSNLTPVQRTEARQQILKY